MKPSYRAVRAHSVCLVLTLLQFFSAAIAAQVTDIAVTTRHSPILNGSGRIEGSAQIRLPENVTLNGGITVTGDFLIPGSPIVQINGTPTFGGTIIGIGSADPDSHVITLNTGSTLGHLRTRSPGEPLPTVAGPPLPNGTRSINLNQPGQSVGPWETLRDLIIQGQAGSVTVPPGTYGHLKANGSSTLRLGVAGSNLPSLYNLQSLTFNGQARLVLDGPVLIALNSGLAVHAECGIGAHPEWLQLHLAAGGVTLNSGATLHGTILAPSGTVVVNGGATLNGSAVCDRFMLNGDGLVRWRDTNLNRKPVATPQQLATSEDQAIAITLTGNDPDDNALAFHIVTHPQHGTLDGTGTHRTYTPHANYHGVDTFTFAVSDGFANSEPAAVTITVSPVNDHPVALAQPVVVTEDTPIILTLRATDLDGDALLFSAPERSTYGTLARSTEPGANPGDFLYTPDPNNTSPDSFAFTVSDGAGGTSEALVQISITQRPDVPVVSSFSVSVPEDGELPITLAGLDQDGEALEFEIVQNSGPAHGSLSGDLPDLIYKPAPNYHGADTIQYIARDTAGMVSEPGIVTIQVLPIDDQPLAPSGIVRLREDESAEFVLQATDPDGESLTYRIEQAPAHGVLSRSGPTFVYTPNLNYHGEDSFTFVAVDSADPIARDSELATISIQVRSVNDAPIAQAQIVSTSEDTAVVITLSATDADADALAFITPRPVEGTTSFAPQHGTLTPTEDPRVWRYTPAPQYFGIDEFMFRVTDPEGVTSDATVKIVIETINDIPSVSPITLIIPEDSEIAINLTGIDVEDAELAFFVAQSFGPTYGALSGTPPALLYTPGPNFHGVDTFSYYAVDSLGFPSNTAPVTITVESCNDAPIAADISVSTPEDTSVILDLVGNDIDNDAVTFLAPTEPTYGTLVPLASGRYRYDPNPNFHGTDSFTYRASDGQTISHPAVVTITVEPRNDAPVAQAQALTAREDTPLTLILTGSDTDGDGIMITNLTLPAHGTLVRDVIDSTRFLYSPDANYSGTDNFSFAVNDGQVSSAPACVTITVISVNDAPQVNVGQDFAISAPALIELNGAASDDGEPAGWKLTYSWSKVEGPGTVAFANSNATQTAATYTHAGTYILRLSVSDGELNVSDDLEVVVGMPNQAPVVKAGPDQRLQEGETATLAGSVLDDGKPAGAPIGVEWSKFSGPGMVNFTNPTSADSAATFSLPGEYVLRLRVSDGVLTSQDHINITVTPANRPPIVNAGPAVHVLAAANASLRGAVEDDGQPRGNGIAVVWSKISGPGTAQFDNFQSAATSATFSVAGEYVIRLTATDGALSAFAETTVTVTPVPNSAPHVNAGPDLTLVGTAITTLQGTASDDGKPAGSVLRPTWSKLSGPGDVAFSSSDSLNPTASFTKPGTYTLQLTVTDGEFAANDHVTVAVNSSNAPPSVFAGEDQFAAYTHSFGPNLLLNPSGETPTPSILAPNWENSARYLRSGQVFTGLAPADGEFYFVPWESPSNDDAFQDVDVANYLTTIQEGRQVFRFSGYYASNGSSYPKLALDFLDATKTVTLRRIEFTGELKFAWQHVVVGCVAPPETRHVRAHMISVVRNTRNGAYFDGLGLVAETLPSIQLTGAIEDDGLPNPPAAIVSRWRQLSGPATAEFSAPTATSTSAVLPGAGTYTFELQGSDGEFTATDSVSITTEPTPGQNRPPTISLPASMELEFPADGNLTATVADDGLPAGAQLAYAWAKYSGPGEVLFTAPDALSTQASFTKPGLYTLRLTTSDGQMSGFADISVHARASSQRRPLDVVIAIDTSGSMTAGIAIQTFVQGFVRNLDHGLDRCGLVYYSVGAGLVVPLTDKKEDLYSAISRYGAGALRNQFSHGISLSKQHLLEAGRPGSEKVMLIISDGGYDQGFEPGPEAAIARAAGIRIVALGFGAGTVPILPSIVSSKADFFDNSKPVLSSVLVDLLQTRFLRGVNNPPQVLPGTSQRIALGQTLNLGATITDDGYPQGGNLTIQWKAIAGPAAVSFSNANAAATQAQFHSAGTYALQVTADDGELSSAGTLIVEVIPADELNSSPVVEAGPDFEIPAAVVDFPLGGTVSDDGRPNPPGELTIVWGKVSGPGQAIFSDPSSPTSLVRFTVAGEYVLELRASDGEYVSRDFLTAFVENDCRPAPAGMVAWFPANGDTVDIFGGLRASGFDYAGYSSGRFGEAFSVVNGTNQYYSVPSSPQLALEGELGITIEFWLRRVAAANDFIVGFGTSSFQFQASGAGYFLGMRDASNASHSLSTQLGGNTTGVWTHLAITFDSATRITRIFANGLKIAENVAPAGFVPKTSGLPLNILRHGIGNTFASSMEMDELAIYERALDAAEVQTLATYRKCTIGFNKPPSVVVRAPASIRIVEPFTLAGDVIDDGFAERPLNFSWSQVSGPGTVVFSTTAKQQTAVNFSEVGTYVLRLSVSDTQFTVTADTTIQVLPPPIINSAPVVRIIDSPEFVHAQSTLQLNAEVVDDGQPGTTVTYQWQRIEGLGQVIFSPANSKLTSVSFSSPGRYLLRLVASDGQLTGSDEVEILVAHGGNQPPIVELGPPRSVIYGQPMVLSPTVDDDGQPGLGIAVQWSIQSGPGSVQLTGTSGADVTAVFARPGAYLLRLEADDGEYKVFDEIEITVTGGSNLPPIAALVSPANGSVVVLGDTVSIVGSASDPEGILTSIEFYADGVLLQSSLDSELPWNPQSLGIHHITMVAEDDIGQRVASAVATFTVVAGPPVVHISYPPSGASFAPGDSVALQAHAFIPPGASSISQLEFLANGVLVATDEAAPYSGAWIMPPVLGSYTLTVRATDSVGQVVTSDPVTIRAVADPNAAPEVRIQNLAGGEAITAPQVITGTVNMPNLRDYRLEYRRKGADCVNWVQFASGDGLVQNGTLGTFDPTVLLNGIYVIRLVARSAYGVQIADEITVGVEGGMKVGLFTVAFNDLELSLAGIPLTVTRIYDSREHCPGDFGHGWKLDLESIRLDLNAPIGSGWNLDITDGTETAPPVYQLADQVSHIASVRMPDGDILRFSPKLVFARDYNRLASVLDSDGDDVAQAWIPLGNNTPLRLLYRPRGGTQGATLTPRGYRANGVVSSTTVLGNPIFYPADPYGGQLLLATEDNTTLDALLVTDATGWELRLKDRRVFLFDDKGRLEQMTDSVGNSLIISRNTAGQIQRVSHSSGRQIVFVRNGEGFITEIEDPNGAKLNYVYDSAGDLRAFYDRATPLDSANPTQSFTYKAGTHYLEELFDGKGIRASRSFYDPQGRLIRTVDADGKEMIFTHNVAGRTETIRDRSNRVTTHHYDERGNVVQTVEPDGTVLAMAYHIWSDGRKSELKTSESITGLFTDESGALVQKTVTTTYAYEDDDPSTPPANDGLLRKVVDPLLHTTRFTYDDRGNVLTVTDPLNRTTSNTYYPGTTLLASTTDALQNTTYFTYDPRGQMDKETRTVTVRDETGIETVQTIVTDHDYNALGQLLKLTDANNHATTYTYDNNGNQLTSTTTRTDAGGVVRTLFTEHEYDAENRLMKTWGPLHLRAAGHHPASETIYDENGKPAVIYDADRRATAMFYSNRGELERTQYADNTNEYTYYDGEGRREFHDDRRGKRTQFVYDLRGRLAETWFLGSTGDPSARLSSTIYDAAGRVYQSTDARNQTTTFVYDDAGRRTATINSLSQRSDSIYDDAGNLWYFTDAKSNTIEHRYDALNRRVRTVFAPTSVAETPNAPERMVATETITVYDELGRRVTEVEQSALDKPPAERRATRYIYDKVGRLTAVVQPEVDGVVPVTRYTYDEIGNQLTQTDALDRTTHYYYDVLGRRVGRQLPGGQTETVSYYRSGPVKDRNDFNGTLTSYTYDSLNRLLGRTSNHANASLSNASFTYTASGQRWTMTDATGTTVYTYDHRDRLKTKATPQGTITYHYEDASGLLTGMHTDTPNGAAVTYTYDELSRLKTVADLNNQVTTYEYDLNGNLEDVILPNGVTSTYLYSATNRLESLGIQKSANTLAQFSYSLAPTGHRHRSVETGAALQPGNPSGVRTRTWSYDALWRLRNESLGGGGALGNGQFLPNGSASYTLDAVGNRKARTSMIAGLASQTFSFDSNDRVQGDASDANGNTLAGTVSQPASTGTNGQDTYDAENRLIARTGVIDSIPAAVAVLYNGDGHKVAECITQNGVTTTTTHLIDELNPTGYAQVIEEKVNGTLTRVYTFGHDLISQDVAAQPGDPWQLVYFGYDGHGSTRFLTDATGSVTDTYEYDAFGELLAFSGNTQNRYRYCGEQYSEALGLYYLRARLMNPLAGRFWTMDEYLGMPLDPSSLHKFGYPNDPLNTTDPSGNSPIANQSVSVGILATISARVGQLSAQAYFAASGSVVWATRGAQFVQNVAQRIWDRGYNLLAYEQRIADAGTEFIGRFKIDLLFQRIASTGNQVNTLLEGKGVPWHAYVRVPNWWQGYLEQLARQAEAFSKAASSGGYQIHQRVIVFTSEIPPGFEKAAQQVTAVVSQHYDKVLWGEKAFTKFLESQ